jgi:hypothetical protein
VPPLELRSHLSALGLDRTFQTSDNCRDYPDIRTVIYTRLAALPLQYFKPGQSQQTRMSRIASSRRFYHGFFSSQSF